jgi:hypothetical protein
MSVLRINRFAWKDIAGIAFFAAIVAYSMHVLYGAWAFRAIPMPRWLFGLSVATLAGEPIRFWIGVACVAPGFVVTSAFLWLQVFQLCNETRSFRIREARPPFDDAIRQPASQR